MTCGRFPAGIVVDVVIVIALAILTVNHDVPERLNADVLLNSIMSLQHVTLFVWGQDRLANFLPLFVWPIRDPAANLFASLVVSAAAFFAMVWFWAHCLARMMGDTAAFDAQRRVIFLILTVLLLWIMRPDTIFEVVVWHIEYSLSYLLLGVAFVCCFASGMRRPWAIVVTGACLAIATGANNSILIPAIVLVMGHGLIVGRSDARSAIFVALAVAAFAGWWIAARSYPKVDIPYTQFDFKLLDWTVAILTNGMAAAFAPGVIVGLIALACLLKMLEFHMPQAGMQPLDAYAPRIVIVLVGFSACWVVLFACNSWVIANKLHYRYFVPVVFAGVMALSLSLRRFLAMPVLRRRHAVPVLLVAGLIAALARPPADIRDYTVFHRTDRVFPAEVGIYAGNYWLVWPAVMKRLLDGRPGFGVAFRAEGNRDALVRYLTGEAARGPVAVGCLDAPAEACRSQVADYLGSAVVVESRELRDGILLLRVTR